MTGWLIDKSALVRLAESPDAENWLNRAERGLISIASPTLVELGFSARNISEWDDYVRGYPVSLLPLAYLTPRAQLRALEVQRLLVAKGQNRAPSVADLQIAAIAEVEAMVILHIDKDFDLIANITGQPIERLRFS